MLVLFCCFMSFYRASVCFVSVVACSVCFPSQFCSWDGTCFVLVLFHPVCMSYFTVFVHRTLLFLFCFSVVSVFVSGFFGFVLYDLVIVCFGSGLVTFSCCHSILNLFGMSGLLCLFLLLGCILLGSVRFSGLFCYFVLVLVLNFLRCIVVFVVLYRFAVRLCCFHFNVSPFILFIPILLLFWVRLLFHFSLFVMSRI